MREFLRQPLLQFFLLAAAIFGLNAIFDDAPEAPDKPSIVVSSQDAQWLASQFQATWRRPPSEAELSGLMDEFVREEIYVREALALGLDQGDTIVRRRLRQKMEFLTEAGAEAATPDDATLQTYLEANSDRFAVAARVSFDQIIVPNAAPEALESLFEQLADGVDPQELARPSLLPGEITQSPPQTVDGIFGTGFFAAVADLPVGEWQGPITSGFGAHLVRLTELEPSQLPSLADIRDRVELDWRAQMARDLRLQRYDELKAQYAIETPNPSDVVLP